jgi:hypothetical protein
MTPSVLALLAIVAACVLVLVVRRVSRRGQSRRVDFGVVSTQWLAELKRDEPWNRS